MIINQNTETAHFKLLNGNGTDSGEGLHTKSSRVKKRRRSYHILVLLVLIGQVANDADEVPAKHEAWVGGVHFQGVADLGQHVGPLTTLLVDVLQQTWNKY